VIPAVAVGLTVIQSGEVPGSVSRLVVQDEVILRVPVQPRPAMPRFNWKEHKGPSCIPVGAIRRALLSGGVVTTLVLLRVLGAFSLPLAAFVVAMAILVELILNPRQ